MSNVVVLKDHISTAWDDYTSARARAETSCDIRDGMEAGRAWRRWLDQFMTEEQKETLGRRSVR